MGPVEVHLRFASGIYVREALPQTYDMIIAFIGTNYDARQVVYGAAQWLHDGGPQGIVDMLRSHEFEDVLTEAICAAEALGL